MGEEIKIATKDRIRRRILQNLNLLEIYGANNIAEVIEWAHREDLLNLELRVGLIGEFPMLTEKGRKWLEKQKIKE
ncbi:hypothetical protein KAT95_00870 [Candidatus Parcubacteria bacterium]|nr:hypothetical protein [Candidatus Parcubacteria bacterium]